jgi:hypothetical protein
VGVGVAVAIGLLVLLTDTRFEYGELVWTVGGSLILAPIAGFITAAVFWYLAFHVDPIAASFSKHPEELSKALDRYEDDAGWYDEASAGDAGIQDHIEQGAPRMPQAPVSTETDQGIKPKEPDR